MIERTIKIGLDAADVKAALRRRHPAFVPQIAGVGRWVCIEEWRNIDLLALDAWREAEVVGYEVKISRGDMRSELLNPTKRAEAVSLCTKFYFAIPAGMLTDDERAFREPDWTPEDFERDPCPAGCRQKAVPRKWRHGHLLDKKYDKRFHKGYLKVPRPGLLAVKLPRSYQGYLEEEQLWDYIKCPTCNGKAGMPSKVEREAPVLWIPKDVGLVAVGPNGCSVIREAPRRRVTESILPWPFVASDPRPGSRSTPEDHSRRQRQGINQLIRWISARPDPRHSRLYSDRIDP